MRYCKRLISSSTQSILNAGSSIAARMFSLFSSMPSTLVESDCIMFWMSGRHAIKPCVVVGLQLSSNRPFKSFFSWTIVGARNPRNVFFSPWRMFRGQARGTSQTVCRRRSFQGSVAILVAYLHLLLQGASSQGVFDHLLCDGEVLWQLWAALDHHWVDAIQKLVAKELVLCPVLLNVLCKTKPAELVSEPTEHEQSFWYTENVIYSVVFHLLKTSTVGGASRFTEGLIHVTVAFPLFCWIT